MKLQLIRANESKATEHNEKNCRYGKGTHKVWRIINYLFLD